MSGCCEQDSEPLGFIKDEEFVDQLSVRPLLHGVSRVDGVS